MRAASLVVLALLTFSVAACTSGSDDATASNDADSEFCKKVRALDSGEQAGPETGVELLASLDDLVDVAPDELEDALATLRRAYEELGASDADAPTDSVALEQFAEVFSRPEMGEALEAVVLYSSEVCGLAPPPTAAKVSVPAPTTVSD